MSFFSAIGKDFSAIGRDIESFFSPIGADFNPGGDPAAIRIAAGAYKTLAAELGRVVHALDTEAADLEKSWKGVGGRANESASAAFQKAWSKFSAAITEYAQGLDEAAAKLDHIADAIQQAEEDAARLKDMAVAAAIAGGLLTVASAGISDGAAVVAAAGDVAAATGVMATLGALLDAVVTTLGALLDGFVFVAARFVMGSAFTWLTEVADKGMHGMNPLDPANYTAVDIANIIRGGMVQAALGVAGKTSALQALKAAHPISYTTAYAGVNGFISTALTEYAIEGKKLDASTIEAVAEGTGIAAASGAAVRGGTDWAATKGGVLGKIFGNNPPGSSTISQIINKVGNATDIKKSNVIDSWANQPGSVLRYNLFIPQPHALTGPHAPSAPPAVPVPQVPPQVPPPVPPPHIGGGTVTVQPGDSLYKIAGQRLGNPNLYPVIQAVNPQVGAGGVITPGQVLHIPQLLPPPPHSTAQVVQPGDSVWGLAGGDPALARRIAELNGLKDPAQIQPGQVLIIPPAG